MLLIFSVFQFLIFLSTEVILAADSSSVSSSASIYSYLIMLGLIVAIFYFFVIRPQNRRAQEQKDMLDSLKKGMEVVFSGGLIGIITEVSDEKIRCKLVGADVEVWALKYSVYSIIKKEQKLEIKKIK